MRATLSVLVALALGLAVPTLAQTPLEEAEVNYTRGLYAKNAEDWAQAAENFHAAATAYPQEAIYWYELGRVENRQRNYANAARALEQARQIDAAMGRLEFELGIAYLGEGQLERAKTELLAAREEDPNHARTHLYLGLVEERLGDASAAATHFERAAALDPDLRDRVDLFLGRVYLAQGMEKKARESFKAASTSVDENVATVSRVYLEQVQELAQQTPRRWSATGSLTVEYDDNVTLNPEDPSAADFPEQEDPEDWRTTVFAGIQYRPLMIDHHTVGVQYSFYRSWHDTLDEFDVEGHLPEIYYAFRSDPFRFRLSYDLEYFDVDSESYLRSHVGEMRFGPGFQRYGYTDLYLQYRDDSYLDEPERDADELTYGIEQYFFPWKHSNRQISLRFEVVDRDAGNDYERREMMGAVAFYSTLTTTWDVYFSLSYRELDYDNIHSYFDVKRQDEHWMFLARTTYDLTDVLALLLQFRYTDHPSNIDFYDYERNVYSLGLMARY